MDFKGIKIPVPALAIQALQHQYGQDVMTHYYKNSPHELPKTRVLVKVRRPTGESYKKPIAGDEWLPRQPTKIRDAAGACLPVFS